MSEWPCRSSTESGSLPGPLPYRRMAAATNVAAESGVVKMSERRIVNRVCPFCEATCGLAVEVEGDSIVGVRGDKDDPFSRGFICPKAYGLKELYHDPERLRRPVRRTATGWEEIGWDEAYEEVASRLIAIRERYGNDAIGMYNGNPVVHDVGALHLSRRPPARAREPQPVQLVGDRHPAEDRPDRPDVRAAVSDRRAGSRHRPHALSPDHRRQSRRLARQPHDDARRAGTAEGRHRARRQGRRHRSAPDGDGADGERAPLHPSRRRRGAAARDRAYALRGGAGRPRRRRGSGRRAGRGGSRGTRVLAGIGGRVLWHRRRTRSGASLASSPRPSPPRATGGWERACRSSARWRAGAAISSTSSPATSIVPAASCSPRPPPRSTPRCRRARASRSAAGRAG